MKNERLEKFQEQWSYNPFHPTWDLGEAGDFQPLQISYERALEELQDEPKTPIITIRGDFRPQLHDYYHPAEVSLQWDGRDWEVIDISEV